MTDDQERAVATVRAEEGSSGPSGRRVIPVRGLRLAGWLVAALIATEETDRLVGQVLGGEREHLDRAVVVVTPQP